jgi:hypothetical protein
MAMELVAVYSSVSMKYLKSTRSRTNRKVCERDATELEKCFCIDGVLVFCYLRNLFLVHELE